MVSSFITVAMYSLEEGYLSQLHPARDDLQKYRNSALLQSPQSFASYSQQCTHPSTADRVRPQVVVCCQAVLLYHTTNIRFIENKTYKSNYNCSYKALCVLYGTEDIYLFFSVKGA